MFTAKTCFVAGTKVHTKDGLKNIEDIQIGDVVLSWNEKTGGREYKTVTELFLHEVELLYEVKTSNGTVLETTWNHPFRVKKHGLHSEAFSIENTEWIEAKDLVSGDVALGADGRELVITDITIDERAETVYNFEVENNHTYFVGENGVLVHNYQTFE
ncbi:polymorphic toxin-type HINT domain-containing protein [Leptospira sp. 96542]|nr:polymorphic toxin-type HINT domain-containing protein [Leptospira sp. 96542]